ncbi:hypothetical protein HHK36_020281 [Tetracentron sinense]|uniref:Disease resistance R13L4/SHOC-2-like LRR domain-containing protein n=1 Tax=Tetracentron sinense TaxID=13715 RepID=A0A834YTE1_TETSI|nr:hypothetical protein HHK36_020281 [Tetracentron sinense]
MLQLGGICKFSIEIECRMHDLMRELALSTSEKENFCTIYDRQEGRKEGKARRLSIHTSYANIQLITSLSQLRTLFVFVNDMTELPSGFRLLRVLDLEDVPIEKLPDEVVDLFNLRYLNLRGTQVKELPKSLGKLRNLETLDISFTKVESLPSGIVKLQRLRYLKVIRVGSVDELLTFNHTKGTQAPVDVWKLKNLPVLGNIEANGEIVKQVGNMTQLTHIGITKVREGDVTELCASISRLHLLRHIGIKNAYNERKLWFQAGFLKLKSLSLVNFPQLDDILIEKGVMPSIRQLFLYSCAELKTPPSGIEYLSNLQELTMFSTSKELIEHIPSSDLKWAKWLDGAPIEEFAFEQVTDVDEGIESASVGEGAASGGSLRSTISWTACPRVVEQCMAHEEPEKESMMERIYLATVPSLVECEVVKD